MIISVVMLRLLAFQNDDIFTEEKNDLFFDSSSASVINARLELFSSVVREAHASRHNWGTIKGPLSSVPYCSDA